MKLHANARTCPNSRRLIVRRIEEERWSLAAAAEAAGVSERTAAKWLARWRAQGELGLLDRSSAPRRRPTQLPAERVSAIEALRRLRMTAAEIAECLGMALSTVSRWLKRIGLGKRSRLEPPEPANRYERKRPGELVHVDVKKLGRISSRGAGHRVLGRANQRSRVTRRSRGPSLGATGWEFCHVCVDDATRLAYVEVLTDERGDTAAGFLRRAVEWFAAMGVQVERVMSDNGSCYRSTVHAAACRELGVKHLRTQPYRPRTNGKAERFIQTLQNRWAYGAIYGSTAERRAALPGWLTHYNFMRRHGSLGHRPPGARLAELEQRHG
jgi:transposase InsO family protein